MKMNMSVTLDEGDITQAIADYVEKETGNFVPTNDVDIFVDGNGTVTARASIGEADEAPKASGKSAGKTEKPKAAKPEPEEAAPVEETAPEETQEEQASVADEGQAEEQTETAEAEAADASEPEEPKAESAPAPTEAPKPAGSIFNFNTKKTA